MEVFLKVFLTTVVVAILCLPGRAFAYLDPGTGSMVLQAVLAAVAAASVSIGLFWTRIKAFFTRNSDNQESIKDDD